MSRKRISTRARVALFERKNGICHMCGGKVLAGEAWDLSHVIPLEIGGADDESNWDVAHRKCHRVQTSKVDIPLIAKTKRQHASHIGAKLSGQGFRKSEPQRRATRPVNKWDGVGE